MIIFPLKSDNDMSFPSLFFSENKGAGSSIFAVPENSDEKPNKINQEKIVFIVFPTFIGWFVKRLTSFPVLEFPAAG